MIGFRCCCEFPLGIQCQSWNWNPWTTLLESGEYLESQYSLGFLECEDVDLKKIYHSALQSYGIGVMIPFGTVGRLELNYSLSQKRFSFLFCAM